MAALQHIDSPERGVLLLDKDLRITAANRRASEILANAKGGGSVLPGSLGRAPSDPEEVIEEVLDSVCGEGTVVHRYSGPVYSSDGTVSGRVEIYSDITARRELEREIIDRGTELARLNRQLRDAQEQLLQSERLRTLGEMAAGIAHDINNVLGIVLGNAQLARRKAQPGSDLMKCIDGIELAARDAAETVRRLREIGKPVDTSHYGPVDLGEVVQDVLQTAVPAWKESATGGAGIRVSADVMPGCVVNGDPTELREALANVVLNAVQASSSGGGIEITAARDGRVVDLMVRDHGAGMSDETKNRLFDPFFTTRGAEGTGLGMSMVDATMIRHGGRVIVESKEGEGTLVTLRFPVKG